MFSGEWKLWSWYRQRAVIASWGAQWWLPLQLFLVYLSLYWVPGLGHIPPQPLLWGAHPLPCSSPCRHPVLSSLSLSSQGLGTKEFFRFPPKVDKPRRLGLRGWEAWEWWGDGIHLRPTLPTQVTALLLFCGSCPCGHRVRWKAVSPQSSRNEVEHEPPLSTIVWWGGTENKTPLLHLVVLVQQEQLSCSPFPIFFSFAPSSKRIIFSLWRGNSHVLSNSTVDGINWTLGSSGSGSWDVSWIKKKNPSQEPGSYN